MRAQARAVVGRVLSDVRSAIARALHALRSRDEPPRRVLLALWDEAPAPLIAAVVAVLAVGVIVAGAVALGVTFWPVFVECLPEVR